MMMSTKTTKTMTMMTMTTMTTNLMQTVEEKFKFLLVDPCHLPLQHNKLFKIDTTPHQ